VNLRVLYLADRADGPYRYRCLQACEQLRQDGVRANVMRSSDPAVMGAISAYSVVVLFRLPFGAEVEAIVRRARAAGTALVFDVDDLVFDPACTDLMPFRARYSKAAWEEAYGQKIRALYKTFQACDLALVSTPALAEHAERLGKPARAHPNLAPPLYLEMARRTARARRLLRQVPTIGYFSGSDTHDADFASIAAPLKKLMLERRDVRLLICGYLDGNPALRGVEAGVVRLPYMSWKVYPWALGACHVTLAPLAAVNAFTDGKSALKFFEAGALGVTTIASPAREFTRAIEHGQNGFIAQTESDFYDALTEALDPEVSERVGAAARKTVIDRYSFGSHRGKLREILESVASAPSGRQPAERAFVWDEYSGRPGKVAEARASARRALELAATMKALAAPRRTGMDLDAIEHWLDAQFLGDAQRVGVNDGLLLSDLEASGWSRSAELGGPGALPGEHRATGSDPYWSSPELVLPGPARYLVLRLRALVEQEGAKAQLFWQTGRRAMREQRSVQIPVATDGTDHTYVVDLWQGASSRFWRKRHESLRLRLDPLDRPGSVAVSALALLPDGFVPRNLDTESASLPVLALPDRRKRAVSALRAAVADPEFRARLKVSTARDTSWLRRVIDEASRDAEVRVECLRSQEASMYAVIARARPAVAPGVDVVVPVYNARKLTLRCLRSVLRHGQGNYRLVVIDDASTDPKLWPALQAFARRKPGVVLLRNRTNLGFSATVNRGISHAEKRDVLVLNSDTKVFAEFLPRLRAAAYADPRTGIVCPLSNNATICSVPEFCRDNPLPSGVTGKQLARLVRSTALEERPELVTPVGFCMYLKRELIEDVGIFDAETYGRGFGEENDLGERAKGRGWRIRLADDVYVLHEGSASFGELGQTLVAQNSKVLEAAHPGYHARVAHFIRENPLAAIQANLHWHLRRKSHTSDRAVLQLLHASPFGAEPGGTEHVVRDIVRALRLPRVVVAYPCDGGIEVAEVLDGDLASPLRYSIPLDVPVPRFAHEHAAAERAFEQVLELFRISSVHIHHLFYWPLSIAKVLRRRAIPYWVTLHDHYAICPSANLLNLKTLELCCPRHDRDDARVTACLGALCSELGLPPFADAAGFLNEHRRAFSQVLEGAEQVLFPSPSAQRLASSAYPRAPRLRVLPHGYDAPPAVQSAQPESGPLRVALLGEVAYASKGANEYLKIIDACGKVAIEWHVFGNAERFGFERQLESTGARVVFHGPYRRGEIPHLLARAGIEVGLLMPIWPETFSLTLSELLSAGIPVVAAAQGALADRLDGQPYGILVEDADAAARALLGLADRGPELEQARKAAREFRHAPVAPWAAEHRELYARSKTRARKPEKKRLRAAELKQLSALKIRAPVGALSGGRTTPAPRYTNTFWYPWAERIKQHVPESVRALARRWLAADGLKITHRLRLPGPRALLGAQLKIVRRYFGTTLLESLGDDPHLLLELPPIPPERIDAVCFNLWCSQPNTVFAQLYWQHKNDTSFSEEKSVTIPLDGRSGAWQEYVIRFDQFDRLETWVDGGEIVAMRFDPINLPGLIGLGDLNLCSAPKRLPGLTLR
jgi:GT2 family glycosyltransferase/glycosyltransferase involved in cell wall biosynthesis